VYQQTYKSHINKRELQCGYNTIPFSWSRLVIVKAFARGLFDTAVGLPLNFMFTINQFIIIFRGVAEELQFILDKRVS